MRTSFASGLLIALAAVLAPACKQLEEPPPPPFQVAITVEADQGVPIPRAVVTRNNQEVGKTDGNGKALLTFRGEEGDQIDVWVKCPEGFDSPTKSITVALHRLADPNKMAEYPVKCPPAEREVVVALLADNGPNLPIKYYGRDIARTDSSGAATFMLKGKPGDHMEFTIDTSAKENEKLRPQNPSVSLVVDNRDAFYALDQPFQKQKTRVIYMAPRRPQPIGPTPLRY
jgi:hypothetical protein